MDLREILRLKEVVKDVLGVVVRDAAGVFAKLFGPVELELVPNEAFALERTRLLTVNIFEDR